MIQIKDGADVWIENSENGFKRIYTMTTSGCFRIGTLSPQNVIILSADFRYTPDVLCAIGDACNLETM